MLLLDFWQKIPGFERYEASYSGRIRHLGKVVQRRWYVFAWEPPAMVEGRGNGNGYIKISITQYGERHDEYAHVLVAKTFIPNPDNLPEINHLNHTRWDNRVCNLQRCTHQQNMEHAAKAGRLKQSGRKKKQKPD